MNYATGTLQTSTQNEMANIITLIKSYVNTLNIYNNKLTYYFVTSYLYNEFAHYTQEYVWFSLSERRLRYQLQATGICNVSNYVRR